MTKAELLVITIHSGVNSFDQLVRMLSYYTNKQKHNMIVNYRIKVNHTAFTNNGPYDLFSNTNEEFHTNPSVAHHPV